MPLYSPNAGYSELKEIILKTYNNQNLRLLYQNGNPTTGLRSIVKKMIQLCPDIQQLEKELVDAFYQTGHSLYTSELALSLLYREKNRSNDDQAKYFAIAAYCLAYLLQNDATAITTDNFWNQLNKQLQHDVKQFVTLTPKDAEGELCYPPLAEHTLFLETIRTAIPIPPPPKTLKIKQYDPRHSSFKPPSTGVLAAVTPPVEVRPR